MAKQYKTYFFNPPGGTGYLSDTGSEHGAKARFVMPPDMTDAIADAIVTLAGGTATSQPIPCPDSTNFTLRKLIFIRQDSAGNTNSIEVAISARQDIITTATTIRDQLNSIGGAGGEVVCIKLKGERWRNRYDELAPVGKTITPGTSSRPTTGINQPIYAGAISYLSDISWGLEKIMPIKVLTNDVAAPPPVVNAAWADCVGTFRSRGACPGRERRKHRRWIVTAAVTQNGQEINQIVEVPNRSQLSADVLACGQALAAIGSTVCLGYIGEDFDRVHLLIGG